MTDRQRVEELRELVVFLANHYLMWDISCDRKYVKAQIRNVERQVGFKMIPDDETSEDRCVRYGLYDLPEG